MGERADIQRLVGDLVRLGTVASVDHAAATCRVNVGDILSGDIPWLTARAGATRSWSPPTVGEQVLILSAEGDLAAGIVLPGLYRDAHPAPWSDPALIGVEYADGARVSYNAAAHHLACTLPAGATATIDAPGGITLRGPVQVEGELRVTGDVLGDRDVRAGGISLKDHRHRDVQAGGAISGKPL